MTSARRRTLSRAQSIATDARTLGFVKPTSKVSSDRAAVDAYDLLIRDDELRSTTRRLFVDGHNAQAVEEACKCLNNVVKTLAGVETSDGADLMRKAFSAKSPILKLNDLLTRSKQDQQRGYMELYAGMMTGVRNPRAHEHAYLDDPMTALELLIFANHLIRMARSACSTP